MTDATRPPLPAAVLWDMDGTVVDTEPFWIAEEEAVVHAAGGVWTDQDALALVGSDLLDAARHILATTPVTGTPEEVVDRILGGVVERARGGMPFRPGALELLTGLCALGVPQALVTMSWTALAEVLLDQLPAGTFATVVTGDQVEHGKPHPEPYLLAARRLGVDPADCVALEDSPTGATSSTSAGVPTLVVPNVVDVPPLPLSVRLDTLAGVEPQDLVRLTRTVRA